MLVIPIAQENSVVRRHPWVSYAVMALCFGVALAINGFGGEREKAAAADEAARKIVTTLTRSPFLEIPEAVAPFLPAELRAQLALAGQRMHEREQVPAAARVSELQAELDALGEDFRQQLSGLPAQRLGYVPSRGLDWRLVSSLFVHAGWLHLLGNMLFFFLSAPFIEDVYGRPLFTGFYILSGVFAAVLHGLVHPGSPVGLVGASGAIAGLMGAFLLRFGTRRIEFLFVPVPFLPMIRTRFLMPANVVLLFWFGQQVLFASGEDSGGVAWWAHLGGFGFGVAVAAAMRMWRIEERYIHPDIEAKISLQAHPALERALDARSAGDFEAARREIATVLRDEPQNTDAWIEAYELALARKDAAEVARVSGRLLELLARAREPALARQILEDERWLPLAPLRLTLAAAQFAEKEGDGRRALFLYEEVVRRHPADPSAVRALVRRGEILLKSGDRRAARQAFEAARSHAAFGPLWASPVERGLERCRG